jgi:hypothetical protein
VTSREVISFLVTRSLGIAFQILWRLIMANNLSVEFEQFLADCDFKHVKASLYYPHSNGLVERFNRALAEGKPVEGGVRNKLVTYKPTAQPATGVSPSKLMSGRQMRMPSNSFVMARHTTGKLRFADEGDDVNVDTGQDDILARVEQHQFNMAAQFNRWHRACKPRFRVRDWVRVRVKKHNKTNLTES